MTVYTCIVYVYIFITCMCVCVYVHGVGNPPDPPFRNQADILSVVREIGYSLLTTQVSLATALRRRDDSVKFTPHALGAVHTQ